MELATEDKESVLVTARIPEQIIKKIRASLDQEDESVLRNHRIIEALGEKFRRIDAGGGSNGTR